MWHAQWRKDIELLHRKTNTRLSCNSTRRWFVYSEGGTHPGNPHRRWPKSGSTSTCNGTRGKLVVVGARVWGLFLVVRLVGTKNNKSIPIERPPVSKRSLNCLPLPHAKLLQVMLPSQVTQHGRRASQVNITSGG